MIEKLDIVGHKFGRLTILEYADKKKNHHRWLCRCECGKECVVIYHNLIRGHSTSCGCYDLELHIKHGRSFTVEYISWQHMKSRCHNPNNKAYHNYGARGIIVCERWRDSFENFLEDMGDKPGKSYTIDRYPNNDGNYEPSNCRWATKGEQQRGRRNNIWLEYNGKRMVIKDWARYFGVMSGSIKFHLKKGKTFEWVYEHFISSNGRQQLA